VEAAEWHDGHLHSSRNPTIWSQGFFAGTTGPVRQFEVRPLCWLSSIPMRTTWWGGYMCCISGVWLKSLSFWSS